MDRHSVVCRVEAARCETVASYPAHTVTVASRAVPAGLYVHVESGAAIRVCNRRRTPSAALPPLRYVIRTAALSVAAIARQFEETGDIVIRMLIRGPDL